MYNSYMGSTMHIQVGGLNPHTLPTTMYVRTAEIHPGSHNVSGLIILNIYFAYMQIILKFLYIV